jgi:hypothetical protein
MLESPVLTPSIKLLCVDVLVEQKEFPVSPEYLAQEVALFLSTTELTEVVDPDP